MIEKIKKIYRKLFRNPPKYKITYKTKIERHGSSYGGWNIILNSLTKNSIVYSFGIGEDISFDNSIIKKYSCNIYAFDPTPKVMEFINSQNLPKEFLFDPIGLSNHDGTLTFYSPENENHISHSIFQQGNKSNAIKVPCQKLTTILKQYKHHTIDLLKMDIEGFEYQVLENMMQNNIKPLQLLVEFHHIFPEIGNAKTEEMIKILENNGYRLFNVSDSFTEYSFVLKLPIN